MHLVIYKAESFWAKIWMFTRVITQKQGYSTRNRLSISRAYERCLANESL